jgi:tetratricopeptide (TPR) repeat protein
LAAAFIVRLLNIIEMSGHNPFFYFPMLDSEVFDRMAQQIAGGGLQDNGVFFMGPLYPLFLALIYSVFGHNLLIVTIIQAILGSVSCVLIFLIARELFNKWTAVIAAGIAVLYGMFIRYDGLILIASLSVFINVLFIYLLILFRKKPKIVTIFLAGILLGLSIIARPNIAVIIPFVLLWLILERKNIIKTKKYFAKIGSFFLFFMIGTGLCVAPITLRNYIAGNDVVLVTASGGINFYIGNSPEATGRYISPFKEDSTADELQSDSTAIAEKELDRQLKPSEVSQYWSDRAVKFIVANPLKYIKLELTKLLYILNAYEVPVNSDSDFFKQYSFVQRLPLFGYGLIAPLALLGMVLCLREWRKYFLLYAVIVVYTAALMLIFVLSHYRIAMVPFIIIFSGYAVAWMIDQLKKQAWIRIIPYLVVLVIFTVVVNWDLKIKNTNYYVEYCNLGYLMEKTGQYDAAIKACNHSIALEPDYAVAHNNLANALHKAGMSKTALAEYNKAIKLRPDYAEAFHNLGNTYMDLGNMDKALENYQKSLNYNPNNADTYNLIAMIYINRNELDPAFKVLSDSLYIQEENPFTHNMIGFIYTKQNQLEKAIDSFARALEIDPNFAEAYTNLGVVYEKLGNKEKAIECRERARQINSDNENTRENIIRIKDK